MAFRTTTDIDSVGYMPKNFSVTDLPLVDGHTLLYLHMDGENNSQAFFDSSMFNRAITAHNSAKISTAQSKFGQSGLFNGTTDYLTVPDDDVFAFGTNTFTIETFFRYNDKTGSQMIWGQRQQDVGAVEFFVDPGNNRIRLSVMNSWPTSAIGFQCPFTADNDTWYHLALVRVNADDAATAWRIFLNGVSQELTLNAGDWNAPIGNFAGTLAIGRNGDFSSTYFNGYLDEYRISSVARYTSNFTVPTRPYAR